MLLGVSCVITICGIGLYNLRRNSDMDQEEQPTPEISEQTKTAKKPLRQKDANVNPDSTSNHKNIVDSVKTKAPKKPKPIIYEGRKISAGDIIRLKKVYFSEDKAILNKDSFEELNKVAQFLKEHPTIKIEIQGHTDKTNNKNYSISLSLRRANSVKDYLTQRGVRNTITVKGFGFSQPLKGLDSDDPANRRVEIRIITI